MWPPLSVGKYHESLSANDSNSVLYDGRLLSDPFYDSPPNDLYSSEIRCWDRIKTNIFALSTVFACKAFRGRQNSTGRFQLL